MKKVRKTFLLPPALIDRIEAYQKENLFSNMTEAVIRLLVIALDFEGGDKKWAKKNEPLKVYGYLKMFG